MISLEDCSVHAKEFGEIWPTFYSWVWLLLVSDMKIEVIDRKALSLPEGLVPR